MRLVNSVLGGVTRVFKTHLYELIVSRRVGGLLWKGVESLIGSKWCGYYDDAGQRKTKTWTRT